jgi:hypothetical protein
LNAELQHRHVISGRVVDPLNLRPADAMLSLGYDRDGAGYGTPVPMTSTGEFVTQVVYPGTYVLMLVRTPYSSSHPPMPVGLSVVQVGGGDLTGVIVTVRQDTAAEGQIRAERGGHLPPAVHITSCLAQEGVRFAACRPAEVTADGRFTLRNAFGLRLLDAGRPARVLLDGRDITATPTDFSTLGRSRLEVIVRASGIR